MQWCIMVLVGTLVPTLNGGKYDRVALRRYIVCDCRFIPDRVKNKIWRIDLGNCDLRLVVCIHWGNKTVLKLQFQGKPL